MMRFLIGLVLMTVALISNGQDTKIDLGFQSGVNISTAYGNNIFARFRSSLTGLHVGTSLRISKYESWGLKLLLTYDRMGWAYRSVMVENNSGTGILDADILLNLDYLNLPILAEYSFGNKVRIHVEGGAFFGILLKNEVITKLKSPVPPGETARVRDTSDHRKRMNFGLSFGSGIRVPVASNVSIDFSLRNNLGLFNIYKPHTTAAGEIKTNTFTISAGLVFRM